MRSMNLRRLTTAFFILSLAVSLRASQADTPGKLFGQTPEEFASRRAKVRSQLKGNILILRGEPDPGDIERVRFRTDNNILYLTGVEAPGALLAILPEGDPSGKREILFLPPVDPGMTVWSDAIPGPGAETEKRTGIESVKSIGATWETLGPSIEKAEAVYLTASGNQAQYTPLGYLEQKIKSINPKVNVEGFASRLINPLRWKKSAGEVDNLRAAIAATGNAEQAAAKAIVAGTDEVSVEGVIIAAFRRGGAVREGFPCIVGSGPNSCVLHHFAGGRKMSAGEMVVVDIGAEYNYYSADVTRTFPCGGKFTARQRALYELVLETQKACEQFVRPGKTTLWELDGYARKRLRESPLRAKDESGVERTMDHFMPHGLGHSLGMDVHDVMSGSVTLEPGVVFTIEPGIYVRSENIGIRIEDDYLVTATGVDKLSKNIPSDPNQVEAMMRAPVSTTVRK
jgi:Xaa-Pro aminopeptidase